MDKPLYSVVVTGEWPGAGQSTTASMLAKRLGFSRVYAGFLFRKFAHIWHLEKEHMSWDAFVDRFVHNKIDLDAYSFDESSFNENILHEWQHQLKRVETPEMWDKIIDQQSLLALQKPGTVVEAKVGVLLDKTGLVKNVRRKHRIFKFLLTCPPEISTHRVIKRKIINHELDQIDKESPKYLELVRDTTNETINRHLRDWERYEKIYGIRRSDIYKPGIVRVYTADRSQEEVIEAIVEIIEHKLKQTKKQKTTG